MKIILEKVNYKIVGDDGKWLAHVWEMGGVKIKSVSIGETVVFDVDEIIDNRKQEEPK